jgi:hypothetical protein
LSNREAERIETVARVLRLSAKGGGVAASAIEVFGRSPEPDELDAARKILLGVPLDGAFSALTAGRGAAGSLLRFLVAQAKINAPEASKRGEKISVLFGRWVRMNERRTMEQKVVAFRSLLVSGVLGGVCAIVSSLAPVLASFQVSLSPQPAPLWYLPFAGLLFAVPSSGLLGVFVSRRRAYLNVLVCTIAYLVALSLFGPIAPVGR